MQLKTNVTNYVTLLGNIRSIAPHSIALSEVFAGWTKAFSDITLAYYNFFKSRSIPVAVSAGKAETGKWIFHRDDARCWFVDFMQH